MLSDTTAQKLQPVSVPAAVKACGHFGCRDVTRSISNSDIQLQTRDLYRH